MTEKARRAESIWRRGLRHLAPFILPRWAMLVVAAIALAAHTAFELLKPWPLKFVFDYVLEDISFVPEWASPAGVSEGMWMLVVVCAMIVAVALLSSTAAYVREYLLKRLGEEVAFELRLSLFKHVQQLGLAFHDSTRLGDTIARITGDTRSIRQLATGSLLQVATAFATLAGMLVVMFKMDAQLALVGLITLPILGPTVWFFRGRIERASKQRRQLEGELTSVTQETMSSIRLVKALGREAQHQRAFGRESSESAQVGLDLAKLEAGYVRAVDFIAALGTCAVVWWGVHRVRAGSLLAGDLLVFAAYIKGMYAPLRDLAKQSAKISKGKAGLERVVEVLDLQPAVVESPDARPAPAFTGRIEFQNVSFAYDPEKPVLENVSFRADPGQVIALVGHSGAGKSTILSLISRLYDPTAGRILIDGADIRDLQIESLREQIGIVLQDSILLQTTILENILYGKSDASPEIVAEAAAAAGVDQFLGRLKDGLYTVVGQRGAKLSGGERQRVAIARAIVRDSAVLLLDEPTTGLDAENERRVMQALARLMEGRTTLLVSHKLNLIERADRILVIEDGRIVESGTSAELRRGGGAYARLLAAAQVPEKTESVR